MITNLLWTDTWVLPMIITVSASISVVLMLIICVCFKGQDKQFCSLKLLNKNQDTETFFSDNLRANTGHGYFRKLSLVGNNNLKITKSRKYENELLNSTDDYSNSFEHAVLQINNTDDDLKLDMANMAYESDETLSCKSDDSKFTANSTFTVTRSSSYAETMKSALSHSDLDKI